MIKDIFAIMGVITTLGVVVTFGYTAFECIVDRVRKRKYHYEVKHRFDKPPTAECYCIDCQRYEASKGFRSGRCCKFEGWYVADNWFCWDATPKEKAGGQE